MDGWHIRHGIAGDIPVFAGALIVFGGIIGAVVAFLYDLAVRHHHEQVR